MTELVMKFTSAKLTSICRNCIFVVLLSSLVLQGASDNVNTTAMSSATSKSTNSSVVTQSMVSTTRSTEGQTTTQVVVTSKPSTEATEPSTPEHAMATSTVKTTSKVLTAIMTTMSATSLSEITTQSVISVSTAASTQVTTSSTQEELTSVENTPSTDVSTTKAEENTKTTEATNSREPHIDFGGILAGALVAFAVVFIAFLLALYYYRTGKFPTCFMKNDDDRNPLNQDVSMRHTKRRSLYNKQKFVMGNMVISKEDFPAECQKKSADDNRLFRMEFLALPNDTQEKLDSQIPENRHKNRYDNILPFDHTRVVLSTKDDPHADYINANFVSGYQYEKKWIASQGPKVETFKHFWQMIWEQNTTTIIMLTRLVEQTKLKCDQYWPDFNKEISYGDYTVKSLETQERNFFNLRTFSLQYGKEAARTIQQFHYIAWPDFGVPSNASHILQFRRRINAALVPHSGPAVIHCSAGVGRTGTYIIIDAAIEQVDAEGKVDLFSFLSKIREQRMKLVQTVEQYAFAHKAIVEYLKFGVTEVTTNDFKIQVQKLGEKNHHDETHVELEFNKLVKLPLQKDYLRSGRQSLKKNRVLQIIPYDFNRVMLPLKPGIEKSDYINASYIDGFFGKQAYIATQGPLENTMEDFWIMAWENRVQNIVMLTNLEEKGHNACHLYWPCQSEENKVFGDITISFIGESKGDVEDCIIRSFTLKHARFVGDDRKLQQFHYVGWPEVGPPKEARNLFQIVSRIRSTNTADPPTIVHCSSGGGRTGVFCCLAILKEQAESDSVVDVFGTARYLREQRPHMIQTQDQLYFCYLSMLEFIHLSQVSSPGNKSLKSSSSESSENQQTTEEEELSFLNSKGDGLNAGKSNTKSDTVEPPSPITETTQFEIVNEENGQTLSD